MNKFVLLLALTSCGQNTSELDYLSWSRSGIKSSTISASREDTIKVCMKGQASEPDLKRATEWSNESLLIWLRALKTIDIKVTSSITYTCKRPHLTWNLRSGNGRSNASPSKVNIYLARPFGTWTHELGHAFAGLSDTYAGGAGKCKRGQPLSLMCWGAYGPRADHTEWSTLYADDIKGVRDHYDIVFKDEKIAPEWAEDVDVTGPLNPHDPWPILQGVTIIKLDNLVKIVGDEATEIDYSGRILDY